jgi:hypothetical protein
MTLNQEKVALGLLIDSSYSMTSMDTGETISSLNQAVKDQLDTEKEVLVYGGKFDNTYNLFLDGLQAKDVNITEQDIIPSGMTALLDGIKFFINDVGSRLENMQDRPGSVIIIILTDGEENASQSTSREEVMKMISHQKEKYNWNFVFLAANQDAIETGATLGIDPDSTCDFHYSPQGMSNVMRTVSNAITHTISGLTPQVQFDNNDRIYSQCIDNDSIHNTSNESESQAFSSPICR